MPDSKLQKLVDLLELRSSGEHCFLGQSEDLGWGTLYGGHLLAQAVMAAGQTVENRRLPHSLHAYFIRPGAVTEAIKYAVKSVRDGGHYTTREVLASQSHGDVLKMMLSCHLPESSIEHQVEMPPVPSPHELISDQAHLKELVGDVPPKYRTLLDQDRAFETRSVEPQNPFRPTVRPGRRQVWYRAKDTLPADPWLHSALLVYISDFNVLTTALMPHGMSWPTPGVMMTSLDHSVWLHRPFRCDDWLLHDIEATTTADGRGFVRGQFFDQSGQLVASIAQEGMIRYPV